MKKEKKSPKQVWPIVFLCLLKVILQVCTFYLAVDKNNIKSCNFDAAANLLIQQHEEVCMESLRDTVSGKDTSYHRCNHVWHVTVGSLFSLSMSISADQTRLSRYFPRVFCSKGISVPLNVAEIFNLPLAQIHRCLQSFITIYIPPN